MKNACWKLFSYLAIDHQAAQAFLNDMAAQGWALDRTWPRPFARFKRTGRTDLIYFLDWSDPKTDEDPDYVRLCADAGWALKERMGYWNIYASKPGTSPIPIQTDSEVEYGRFRKKVLKRMVFSGGLAALILLFYLLLFLLSPWDWEAFLFDSLSQSCSLPILLFLLPFWLAGGVGYSALLFCRLLSWKKALRAGVPPPSPKAPGLWKVLSALMRLSLFPPAVACLADLLLNGQGNWGIPVGCLAGGLLLLSRDQYTNPQLRRRAPLAFALAVLTFLLMRLHGPVRERFPGRLPPAPIVAGDLVETGRHSYAARTDGLLGSYAVWLERSTDDQGQPHPRALYQVSARTWISPALAERALETATADMVPVAGRDGVWRSEWGDYLFFRGTSILELRDRSAADASPLDGSPILAAVPAWLEKLD